MPIIPELMTLLHEAHAIASDSERIVTLSESNRARTFSAILDAAGINVWDDLFQTLRRSCETHLVGLSYEAHAVAHWLGHSERVSKNHYPKAYGDTAHCRRAWSALTGSNIAQLIKPAVKGG